MTLTQPTYLIAAAAVTSLLALITSGLDDTGIRNTPPAQETKLLLSNVTLRSEKHDGTILVQRIQSKSNYGTRRNNDCSEKVLEYIGPIIKRLRMGVARVGVLRDYIPSPR